jgi:hypothetical protein
MEMDHCGVVFNGSTKSTRCAAPSARRSSRTKSSVLRIVCAASMVPRPPAVEDEHRYTCNARIKRETRVRCDLSRLQGTWISLEETLMNTVRLFAFVAAALITTFLFSAVS